MATTNNVTPEAQEAIQIATNNLTAARTALEAAKLQASHHPVDKAAAVLETATRARDDAHAALEKAPALDLSKSALKSINNALDLKLSPLGRAIVEAARNGNKRAITQKALDAAAVRCDGVQDTQGDYLSARLQVYAEAVEYSRAVDAGEEFDKQRMFEVLKPINSMLAEQGKINCSAGDAAELLTMVRGSIKENIEYSTTKNGKLSPSIVIRHTTTVSQARFFSLFEGFLARKIAGITGVLNTEECAAVRAHNKALKAFEIAQADYDTACTCIDIAKKAENKLISARAAVEEAEKRLADAKAAVKPAKVAAKPAKVATKKTESEAA